MPILMSLLAAIIPMVLYLLVIWKMDKNEPEPIKFVISHFLWGALGAIFFGILGSEILSWPISSFVTNAVHYSLLQTVLVAPFVEEITKGIYLFNTSKSRKFDNLTDGLVYGGAIGLGFGMTENFLYFIAYGDTLEAWLFLVIIRSGFSAVMHCMATATVGAFFGMSKFTKSSRKKLYPFLGLLIAMFIHFLWNFSVSFEQTSAYGFLMMFLIVATFFIVYRFSLRSEMKIISEELGDEVESGLLPEEHVTILSSAARFKRGWIHEKLRAKYSLAATKLAFRKREIKFVKAGKRNEYESDIELLRQNISEFLGQNK